jgi:hypothetical protein
MTSTEIRRIFVQSPLFTSSGYCLQTTTVELEFRSGALHRYAAAPRVVVDELMAR